MPALGVALFGSFGQSGGSNIVGTVSIDRTSYELSGGVLNVTNVYITGGYLVLSDQSFRRVGEIRQSGGTNHVANLLSVGDEYELLGGLLYASNITVTGTMIVSSNASVVANPGTIALGGTLQLLGTTQNFGALTLSNNSVVDFGTNASTVRFLPSANQPWAATCVLGVTNWQGNTNGGGWDRLYIGSTSSGISPSQLWQIEFRNPAGFPTGMYAARILSTGEIVPTSQVNSWTKPASDHWESNYWSLGSLPAGNQSVFITNAGYKAVGIFPATVANYSNTLTVRNLNIGAPNNALSTLLLNYAGTPVPLKVLDGFGLTTNGTLLNYYSAFEVDGVDGGNLIIDGGNYAQEGGTLIDYATNLLKAGSICITNANASFSNVFAGGFYPGVSPQIVQAGGTVSGLFQMANGSYELLGGTLSGTMTLGKGRIRINGPICRDKQRGGNARNEGLRNEQHRCLSPVRRNLRNYNLSIGRDYECYGEFDQFGGSVDVSLIQIGPSFGPTLALLTITNGALLTSSIDIRNASVTQSGGVVNIREPRTFTGSFTQTAPTNHGRPPIRSIEACSMSAD